MPRKVRELRADLRRAGFAIHHQTGSHQIWKHSLLSGISVVVAGRGGADAKPYQESQLRRALQALREVQERRQS